MKKLSLIALFASIRLFAASALGPIPSIDTVSDLASYRAPRTQPYVAVKRFATDRNYWPEERIARYDATATNTIRSGCVDASPTGVGRYIFDDCFDERPLDIRWTGGESVLLTGLTNRFTASFIPIDSMPAWEAARDLKSELGGGVIKLEYGEYRFGSDATPGSLIYKPNIGISGQFGGPMGDEAHEGTYANDNVSRTMIGTKIHIYNAGTNGAGLPPIVASAKLVPAYTNSPIGSFTDANSEWISYNRGGNFLENVGVFGSWDWPWNGTNYPGANLVIDEVAGFTFRNVYFGPSAGPAIWARGAFGLRGYDFFIDTPLTTAIVIVDTSDTRWSRGTVAAARGASFSFTGEIRTNGVYQSTANTHIIDDVDVWNNSEELVGWTGTSQTTTNYTITESSGVRRTGWSVDPVTDLFGVMSRMGADTGLPVMVRGTDIPGGLNTNAVYYVRWGTANSTNFYLHNTSGRAIRGGTPLDITSNGTNWWLEAPAAQIFARDFEEIKIDGMRADQSMSGVGDFTRGKRVLINGLFAWEIGLNQTETRQSRKQTFLDPNIIGIRLENVNSFNLSGSSLIGSKGNSGLSTPWVHNSYGIVALGVHDSKISALFDRFNTGIYFDANSSHVNTDGASFGSWVSKPIEATDGYGIVSHVPYFNANTNSQIVATLGAAHTNITGDFAFAIKAQVPTMVTNGYANGRHSALVNLTSITNTTSYGALVPKSAALSFWRSSIDNSINLVTTLGGTNYDPTVPASERFAIGCDVTPFIGKTIEIVYQRFSNAIQIYVEGQLKQNAAINNSTTGNIYAPYLLMGQVGDAGQFSHAQAPIYGIAFHRSAFTKDEINEGVPWARHNGTNAVIYWDFDGASLAGGVKDWSGNGHDGVVQQIGAIAPSFGTTREYQVVAGTGVTITRNGKRSITINTSPYTDENAQDAIASFLVAGSNISLVHNDGANTLTVNGATDEYMQDLLASMLVAGANISISYDDPGNTLTITGTGGSGSTTNGSSAFFNSVYMSTFNMTSSADITNIVSGTNAAPTLLTQAGITAGTYPYATVAVNSKGIVTGISSNAASSGGGAGTNVFLNGLLIQPARFTNNPSVTGGVVWLTNANGHIVGYATNVSAGGGGTTYTFTNTDGNVVLTLTDSTNLAINLNTNIAVTEVRGGTLILSNAITAGVGGTGRSNLTAEAVLVGQGTNAIKMTGPTGGHGLMGWSNGIAVPYTAGSGITLNGSTVVASGGGGGTFSTNNLGYLERSATVITIQQTDGEVSPWTITIPGNTLGVDGDEVKIHTSGVLTIYSASGGDNGYSWRLVADSASLNAAELSTTNRYFSSSGSPTRSVDWDITVKRVSTNTIFVTTTHSVGPGYSLLNATNASTNIVTTMQGRYMTLTDNLNTDPIDFSFYTDIADDARAATMILYGYLVSKVGSSSAGGGASALNDLTDATITSATTNNALTYDGSQWVNTNALTLSQVSLESTNAGSIALWDGHTNAPKSLAITAPDIISTNYVLRFPSNAIPGLAWLVDTGTTNPSGYPILSIVPVPLNTNNGYKLMITNSGAGLFWGL